MSKHEIDIPELPEGWKPVALRPAIKGKDWVLVRSYDGELQVVLCDLDDNSFFMIVEKIQPRRIVLEETNEKYLGNQVLNIDGTHVSIMTAKKWREVKEADLSLTKDDPLRSMKIRQAETGQPVWVRRPAHRFDWDRVLGNVMVDYIQTEQTTTPNWNIQNAEYSFTPFED